MSSRTRETSTVMVKVPDFTELLKEVTEAYRAENPAFEGDLVLPREYGYVETSMGVYYLDIEGCGCNDPVDSGHKMEIWLYEKSESSVSIVPITGFRFSVGDLLLLNVTKEVPLHEFIRTFGRRLESNYRSWKEELETAVGS